MSSGVILQKITWKPAHTGSLSQWLKQRKLRIVQAAGRRVVVTAEVAKELQGNSNGYTQITRLRWTGVLRPRNVAVNVEDARADPSVLAQAVDTAVGSKRGREGGDRPGKRTAMEQEDGWGDNLYVLQPGPNIGDEALLTDQYVTLMADDHLAMATNAIEPTAPTTMDIEAPVASVTAAVVEPMFAVQLNQVSSEDVKIPADKAMQKLIKALRLIPEETKRLSPSTYEKLDRMSHQASIAIAKEGKSEDAPYKDWIDFNRQLRSNHGLTGGDISGWLGSWRPVSQSFSAYIEVMSERGKGQESTPMPDYVHTELGASKIGFAVSTVTTEIYRLEQYVKALKETGATDELIARQGSRVLNTLHERLKNIESEAEADTLARVKSVRMMVETHMLPSMIERLGDMSAVTMNMLDILNGRTETSLTIVNDAMHKSGISNALSAYIAEHPDGSSIHRNQKDPNIQLFKSELDTVLKGFFTHMKRYCPETFNNHKRSDEIRTLFMQHLTAVGSGMLSQQSATGTGDMQTEMAKRLAIVDEHLKFTSYDTFLTRKAVQDDPSITKATLREANNEEKEARTEYNKQVVLLVGDLATRSITHIREVSQDTQKAYDAAINSNLTKLRREIENESMRILGKGGGEGDVNMEGPDQGEFATLAEQAMGELDVVKGMLDYIGSFGAKAGQGGDPYKRFVTSSLAVLPRVFNAVEKSHDAQLERLLEQWNTIERQRAQDPLNQMYGQWVDSGGQPLTYIQNQVPPELFKAMRSPEEAQSMQTKLREVIGKHTSLGTDEYLNGIQQIAYGEMEGRLKTESDKLAEGLKQHQGSMTKLIERYGKGMARRIRDVSKVPPAEKRLKGPEQRAEWGRVHAQAVANVEDFVDWQEKVFESDDFITLDGKLSMLMTTYQKNVMSLAYNPQVLNPANRKRPGNPDPISLTGHYKEDLLDAARHGILRARSDMREAVGTMVQRARHMVDEKEQEMEGATEALMQGLISAAPGFYTKELQLAELKGQFIQNKAARDEKWKEALTKRTEEVVGDEPTINNVDQIFMLTEEVKGQMRDNADAQVAFQTQMKQFTQTQVKQGSLVKHIQALKTESDARGRADPVMSNYIMQMEGHLNHMQRASQQIQTAHHKDLLGMDGALSRFMEAGRQAENRSWDFLRTYKTGGQGDATPMEYKAVTDLTRGMGKSYHNLLVDMISTQKAPDVMKTALQQTMLQELNLHEEIWHRTERLRQVEEAMASRDEVDDYWALLEAEKEQLQRDLLDRIDMEQDVNPINITDADTYPGPIEAPQPMEEDMSKPQEEEGGGYIEGGEEDTERDTLLDHLGVARTSLDSKVDYRPHKVADRLDPVHWAQSGNRFNRIWGELFGATFPNSTMAQEVVGGSRWMLANLAKQRSGPHPMSTGILPLVGYPAGRQQYLFNPLMKAALELGTSRPANMFRKKNGFYNRLEDLAGQCVKSMRATILSTHPSVADQDIRVAKLQRVYAKQ